MAVAAELEMPGSRLGADPGEVVVEYLGQWSIRLLLATLAVSTLRRLFNQPRLLRVRRMLGLFAFTYVGLHFCAYLGLLAEFDWALILEDLTERTYIIAGFLALALLIPLAITSTNGWQRRLKLRWRNLHQLIYPICGLALLHLWWLTKDGYGEPIAYLLIYLILIADRLRLKWLRQRAAGV
ncbi:MAG: protein-methionine-sulfoxide reductase heme-binding subunit MsrQ [Pseudomonadales bacterium]